VNERKYPLFTAYVATHTKTELAAFLGEMPLSKTELKCLTLYHIDGYSYKQIAAQISYNNTHLSKLCTNAKQKVECFLVNKQRTTDSQAVL
jgi:predicted DNA-binding protein (UPF0251 family)